MYFYDTETLGFYGQPVTVQYALNNDTPTIYNFWTNPVSKSLKLIEDFMEEGVCGFNLTFDHFQLCKIYTLFEVILKDHGDIVPRYLNKDYLIEAEYRARDGSFLRPRHALDLMLFVQKGPYQHCMERKDLRIRKIPVQIVKHLCHFLNQQIKMDPILFKGGAASWSHSQSKDHLKKPIPGFHDVFLKFTPSLALKSIAEDIGLVQEAKRFKDIMPEDFPLEFGFAPFAKAFYGVKKWSQFEKTFIKKHGVAYKEKLKKPHMGTWVDYLDEFIEYWETNQEAREYALDDVIYTRGIWEHYGRPEPDDDDSILACCVATCRWRGYTLDLEALNALKPKLRATMKIFKDFNKTKEVRHYITELMSPVEREIILKLIGDCTDEVSLKKVVTRGGPSGERAQIILDARQAKVELNMVEKLCLAGRFHASFRIIGTLSSRMSGADGLNPQGIKREKYMRKCFPLAEGEYTLCGGDFSGFEVCIFEAVSNDPQLRKDLLSGKKIHATFGSHMYGMTYEEILATEKTANDLYTKSKSGLFAMLYGGEAPTLQRRLGVTLEQAECGQSTFLASYPKALEARLKLKQDFTPMVSDEGGFNWVKHEDSVESLFGFKRYFTIEFSAAKALFDCISKIPDSWKVGEVFRTKGRAQTFAGAIMSAIYGAIGGIQGAVYRQAVNHRIQSTGAQVTKKLERLIWELQPIGAHKCVVQPFNVHDEIMCPTTKPDEVTKIVRQLVEDTKSTIPLVAISWEERMNSWAEK